MPGPHDIATGRPDTAAEVERPLHLLTLTADDAAGLAARAERVERHLAHRPDQSWPDVCYTAGVTGRRGAQRLALAAATRDEAMISLRRFREGDRPSGMVQGRAEAGAEPPLAFLFTGQGSQFVGMARELYATQPVFRRTLDRCDVLLSEYLDRPLLSVVYPPEGEDSPLNQTAYTQPALFSVEYALAEMWRAWGVEPTWVMGHSVGEYVAACVAGVFDLEDGLKLIAARGRLMQALPRGGAMVALAEEPERVTPLLAGVEERVSVAAVNSPKQIVLSGDETTLQAIVARLEGVRAGWLQVSHAFHSPRMEPMLDDFAAVCRTVTFAEPRRRLVSNVTGRPAGSEVQTPDYWTRHVREAVLFAAGVRSLVNDGARLLLEVGPKPILTGLGRQCVSESDVVWLSTLRGKAEDWRPLLTCAGELFVRGIPVDFEAVDQGYPRRRVSLPA